MGLNFDFMFVKNGGPVVTLSSSGIAVNAVAAHLIRLPACVLVGFDEENMALGIQPVTSESDPGLPTFEFASRMRNDWIRIGAKDFLQYLSERSGFNFMEKAMQFRPVLDKDTGAIVVYVRDEYVKK